MTRATIRRWTLLATLALADCTRSDPGTGHLASASARIPGPGSSTAPPPASLTSASGDRAPTPDPSSASLPPKAAPPRILRFAWRPRGANAREYAMPEAEDQHQIVFMGDVAQGGRYPTVIGFHGQPGRGQSPRDYAFLPTAREVTQSLVAQGAVGPLILVLPVFRFSGRNWPSFDLLEFSRELERILAREGVASAGYYLFGHSAGAGCGGDGLNRAHELHPRAVGFFDTCVGPGLAQEVAALRREHISTLIVHSVETAGYHPRPPVEYVSDFDYGKVYAPLGMRPASCPKRLPDAPLRNQPYRCASDPEGSVRALVVDTGEGQVGHDGVIPVALRYFLLEFLGSRTP